jgi:hypothetical protein
MSEINTDFPHVPWLPCDHTQNRQKIPPEQLDLFRGQYVAYSWEGDRIVAGAASKEERGGPFMNDFNTAFPHVPFLPREFHENLRNIPPEELDRCAGKYVAYSLDGSQIVADDSSREGLRKKLIEGRIDPQKVVFGYIDDL